MALSNNNQFKQFKHTRRSDHEQSTCVQKGSVQIKYHSGDSTGIHSCGEGEKSLMGLKGHQEEGFINVLLLLLIINVLIIITQFA